MLSNLMAIKRRASARRFCFVKNLGQSGKRNNGVLDRLCQTKYYFQKAKKLF